MSGCSPSSRRQSLDRVREHESTSTRARAREHEHGEHEHGEHEHADVGGFYSCVAKKRISYDVGFDSPQAVSKVASSLRVKSSRAN